MATSGMTKTSSTNNMFDDISTRSHIFRSKLIDEFRLMEGGVESGSKDAPSFSTKDIDSEPERFKRMLREAPGQLIKFKLFKRYAIMHQGQQEKDKRLTRIRNINTLPIGVWAHWLIQRTCPSPPFFPPRWPRPRT
eukprot:TRINITY_DN626_c0_g1_i17.p1 TRINITY_DN626_c0_g1~~TRINITY_DN626_c0_g1_i17.p1  ORF type:complete len:136 (-),score=0.57 TRINITY_DN626_c0_g1_i17:539-946(-)